MAENRKTAISWVDANRILIRGYRVEELIGRVSWGEAVGLLLLGDVPDERTAKMIEAILVAVIDHGVSPPSTVAAMTAVNTGASLSASVAAGLLTINRFHGGAIEDCMQTLEEAVEIISVEGLNTAQAAERIVVEAKAQGERIHGFGHRFHGADPRTARLFELARELGIADEYVEMAEAIESALATSSGRVLPINADGAIAALLCEMKFQKEMANGLFMIARVCGLVARVTEEQTRNKPMKAVNPKEYEYDGAPERKLERNQE